MSEVVIVQPYVPAYRVGFFEPLVDRLASIGVNCRVVAGTPDRQQEARGDGRAGYPWLTRYRPRRLRVWGHSFELGGSIGSWRAADAVILGLEGTSLDVYRAILRRRTGMRLGLWGHVDNYVSDGSRIDRCLETRQARLSDRIFAYTKSGASRAREMGVSAANISVVMNSMDTAHLSSSMNKYRQMGVSSFRREFGLEESPVIGYIGGLDKSKRIDFLAAVLDELWVTAPDVRLMVAGRGNQERLLDRSVERGQSIRLGYADDDTVAMIGTLSDAFVMPGRIGLLAVQSLAMGVPILTTEYPYHAPEKEYLTEGISVFTSKDDRAAYAKLIVQSLGGGKKTIPGAWKYPTVDGMVSNFAEGVVAMLQN